MILKEAFLNYPGIVNIFGDQSSLNDTYTVSTDSRKVNPSDCFIAIKGEKFDAFDFIKEIKTSSFYIFESSDEKNETAKNLPGVLISVDSISKFIFHLCEKHAKDCFEKGVKTIAISGSNGKTTTKEMVKFFLDSISIPNIATLKNDNNHFGVPFTVFRINPSKHKVAVIEYGSNHPGEIEDLCNITYPESGITTNIGFTHMEFFPELEDVFKEESRIFHRIYGLANGEGFFLINNDDDYLKDLSSKGAKTFGLKKSDFHYQISDQEIHFGEITLKNKKLLGDYNLINLANAFNLTLNLFPEKQNELINAASLFESKNNRSQWISWNNKEVFLDAYNANPSSMKVAIRGYVNYINSKNETNSCIIIGDMNELGEKSEFFHEDLAKFVSKFDLPVIYIGRFRKTFSDHFKGKLLAEENINQVNWDKELSLYDHVFAKASRSLQLEKIFDNN